MNSRLQTAPRVVPRPALLALGGSHLILGARFSVLLNHGFSIVTSAKASMESPLKRADLAEGLDPISWHSIPAGHEPLNPVGWVFEC